MPRERVERRVPWPRDRRWRPGEPMTFSEGDASTTYLLRGVHRDTEPDSEWAVVTLEPVRSIALEEREDDALPAAG